jgi:hypothetical protein
VTDGFRVRPVGTGTCEFTLSARPDDARTGTVALSLGN